MNKINLTSVVLMFIFQFATTSFSQEQAQSSFALQQAIDYAKENSANVKNAKLDLEIAKKKIWETTAIGLPQVSGKISGTYMLTVPSTLEEFSSLGAYFGDIYGMIASLAAQTGNMSVLMKLDSLADESEGEEESSIDDIRWGLTADITVSQLIFSGAYIVGLQTSKAYKNLSEIAISKSEIDVVEAVTNAYYIVLITEENKTLLDSTFKNTSELLKQITEMNKQGFVEETDVDQLRLTISNINNALEMIRRQNEVAKLLLKFQMGYPMENSIELTDKLDDLMTSSDMTSLISSDFNTTGNIDFKLLEMQEKLAQMNVKYQKSTFLPDIVAFYSHQENFNKNSFSFTPPNMVGVSMSIPIFGSGMKLAKTKQAQLSLEKIENVKTQVTSGLLTSYNEAKSSLQTAYAQYLNNKDNVKLSEKIYNKTIIKYKEGVASSLELTQAQNQYLQTQTTYYTSIIQLQSAKTKLEKLLTK
ncbi:MAG TPA: hypothetical protein DDX39_02365 [Bacteroidales bacterium]|nr:MAG: hypothetical protein A2W98_05560 [Bacteroidetes bacterium GWF2_33_38]OFY91745.1 MAG: hypothetical protein A2236_05890 [Bacteroidetes bacterium RIFOXYA2_FULL_33_7]HBF87459.1 hypothetical protein [Bacteroidales bacterium]